MKNVNRSSRQGNRWWNLPLLLPVVILLIVVVALTWGGRFIITAPFIMRLGKGARYGVVQPNDVTGMKNHRPSTMLLGLG